MLLTVRQASNKTGISLSLLYTLCSEGRLPHYRIGAGGRRGKVMIDEEDLHVFLTICRVMAIPVQPSSHAVPPRPKKPSQDGFIFLPPRRT